MTTWLESKKEWILNLFLYFYFFIQDCWPNIALNSLKLYKHIDNIHSEGTLSQNCNIGPSLVFMSENGKIFYYFYIIIILDFIK